MTTKEEIIYAYPHCPVVLFHRQPSPTIWPQLNKPSFITLIWIWSMFNSTRASLLAFLPYIRFRFLYSMPYIIHFFDILHFLSLIFLTCFFLHKFWKKKFIYVSRSKYSSIDTPIFCLNWMFSAISCTSLFLPLWNRTLATTSTTTTTTTTTTTATCLSSKNVE